MASSHEETFRVRRAAWNTDLPAIRRIRDKVFVDEQDVAREEEWDGLDPDCLHVLAEDQNRDAIGTARLHPSGKIGRMAVVREWRGRRVGAAMLDDLIRHAREWGLGTVFLHAQTRVMGFYERAGFEAEGEEFEEAGIAHFLMRMKLAVD